MGRNSHDTRNSNKCNFFISSFHILHVMPTSVIISSMLSLPIMLICHYLSYSASNANKCNSFINVISPYDVSLPLPFRFWDTFIGFESIVGQIQGYSLAVKYTRRRFDPLKVVIIQEAVQLPECWLATKPKVLFLLHKRKHNSYQENALGKQKFSVSPN